MINLFRPQVGHVRELQLEDDKMFKMITRASRPPLFGKRLEEDFAIAMFCVHSFSPVL